MFSEISDFPGFGCFKIESNRMVPVPILFFSCSDFLSVDFTLFSGAGVASLGWLPSAEGCRPVLVLEPCSYTGLSLLCQNIHETEKCLSTVFLCRWHLKPFYAEEEIDPHSCTIVLTRLLHGNSAHSLKARQWTSFSNLKLDGNNLQGRLWAAYFTWEKFLQPSFR